MQELGRQKKQLKVEDENLQKRKKDFSTADEILNKEKENFNNLKESFNQYQSMILSKQEEIQHRNMATGFDESTINDFQNYGPHEE